MFCRGGRALGCQWWPLIGRDIWHPTPFASSLDSWSSPPTTPRQRQSPPAGGGARTKVEELLDEERKLARESDAVHLAHPHQVQQQPVHLRPRPASRRPRVGRGSRAGPQGTSVLPPGPSTPGPLSLLSSRGSAQPQHSAQQHQLPTRTPPAQPTATLTETQARLRPLHSTAFPPARPPAHLRVIRRH